MIIRNYKGIVVIEDDVEMEDLGCVVNDSRREGESKAAFEKDLAWRDQATKRDFQRYTTV